MSHRFIQVGTGGRGETWCRALLQPAIEAGLVDPVAAVDVAPEKHANAREHLDLPESACYTDVETAFAEHDADFATCVVPPEFHEDVVDAAIDADLHVLSEKPIADTFDASIRITEKMDRAGLKMGLTMNHRFNRHNTTFREFVRGEEPGPLDFLVFRFANDQRYRGDAGGGDSDFRYDMDHPLLIEGSIHHLDMIAAIADSPCESLYAQTWTPRWADYSGDAVGLINMRFANGVKAAYEGSQVAASDLEHDWGREYARAECRDATVQLDRGEITTHPHTRSGTDDEGRYVTEKVPLEERETWSTAWLVEQFVEWLDGGDPMPTNVDSALESAAIMFGAIESSARDERIDVRGFLDEQRDAVRATDF